jgi:streptomycin 6-kinase
MTGTSARARRIVRVRTAEHRIAQVRSAQAARDAHQIVLLVERIDSIRCANDIEPGLNDGATLRAKSELVVRLHGARQSTAAPLEQAIEEAYRRQASSVQAQLKLDGATRLVEKAEREEAAHTEQRAIIARGFRPAIKAGEQS